MSSLLVSLSRLGTVITQHCYFIALGVFSGVLLGLVFIAHDAEERYQSQFAGVMYDRNGTPIAVPTNSKGHYFIPLTHIPDTFAGLLIQKEDRFFRYHPGVNPLSLSRALIAFTNGEPSGGASTLSQQLAKNILGTETNRTVKNKAREGLYALALEIFLSKDEILLRYANTVYMGNQIQGFETASRAYFNKPLAETTRPEHIMLLATLSRPSTRNPWEDTDHAHARALSERLGDSEYVAPRVSSAYSFQDNASFELVTVGITCTASCATTVDSRVTAAMRAILARHIDAGWSRGARNGAIVVLDPKTSEVIALVGSSDPRVATGTAQINMSIAPRPIGSTIKPFIYLKGFMEGLRPYTLVDDREYKYPIATGYALYPKNYDGSYRGVITLHEALANSLNVPSVKVLEYIGLDSFYAFLGDTLRFLPLRDFDSYQYGIALGGLEMDLLTLTHYFTVFPRGGTLAPLHILQDQHGNTTLLPQSHIDVEIRVADKPSTELVHTILSDRITGVHQFGLRSTLSLPLSGYGVKTGTSRDFHDSWVVGYTSDIVVGVWLGNAENEPLDQISGQTGAGAIWHDAMTYLSTTPYVSGVALRTPDVVSFPFGDTIEYGLHHDDVESARQLLLEDLLITSPHQDDTFEFQSDTHLPLRASREVVWTANGALVGRGTSVTFAPTHAGAYEIAAITPSGDRREIVRITLTQPE